MCAQYDTNTHAVQQAYILTEEQATAVREPTVLAPKVQRPDEQACVAHAVKGGKRKAPSMCGGYRIRLIMYKAK